MESNNSLRTDNTDENFNEAWPNVSQIMAKKISTLGTRQFLYRRLPVLKWLPKYKKSYIVPDLVAGLTVALTVIPQGIADAALAGLPTEYGLYAGFMGCFVYFFFGSTKDLTIGPTAILSILTYTVANKLNADLAVFATFISGIIITLFGVFNLGFLMQFLSMPTISAFMNAATVTIAVGQIRRLLGVKSGKTNEFIASIKNLFLYYEEIRWTDSLLGIISLILLIAVKKWSMKNKKNLGIRYLSISRNAIAVFGGILLAYIFHISGNETVFNVVGEANSGFPSLKFPPISTSYNGTDYGFVDMLKQLGLSLFSIPLVSIIEAVAIAKSFTRGKVLDVTQEMIALGLGNFFSAFVSSIPITGSFTRTAINNASGVKTPFGGIYTGAVVLFSLAFLTKTFKYIPTCSLAAVIIAAMFTMMNFGEIGVIWRTKRIDLIPFFGTFIVSLLYGLEFGILIGVAIDMVFTIYRSSRPNLQFEYIDDFMVVKSMQCVIYSSAEYVKEKVIKRINDGENMKNIIIDGSSMCAIDMTAVRILTSLVEDCELIEVNVFFWNWGCGTKNAVVRFNEKYKEMFVSKESYRTIRELIESKKMNENGKAMYI